LTSFANAAGRAILLYWRQGVATTQSCRRYDGINELQCPFHDAFQNETVAAGATVKLVFLVVMCCYCGPAAGGGATVVLLLLPSF
jgi:hypothetical protein